MCASEFQWGHAWTDCWFLCMIFKRLCVSRCVCICVFVSGCVCYVHVCICSFWVRIDMSLSYSWDVDDVLGLLKTEKYMLTCLSITTALWKHDWGENVIFSPLRKKSHHKQVYHWKKNDAYKRILFWPSLFDSLPDVNLSQFWLSEPPIKRSLNPIAKAFIHVYP